MNHLHPAIFVTDGSDWRCFHSPRHSFHKIIGKGHEVHITTIVLRHLYQSTPLDVCQALHVCRIRASELVDILVVITNCNHTHVLVLRH